VFAGWGRGRSTLSLAVAASGEAAAEPDLGVFDSDMPLFLTFGLSLDCEAMCGLVGFCAPLDASLSLSLSGVASLVSRGLTLERR